MYEYGLFILSKSPTLISPLSILALSSLFGRADLPYVCKNLLLFNVLKGIMPVKPENTSEEVGMLVDKLYKLIHNIS